MTPLLFEEKDSCYAYYQIHDFFDNFGLSSAVRDMETILKAAVGAYTWKKDAPAHLLYFMEKLSELCSAAYVIHHNRARMQEGLLVPPQNGIPDMAIVENFLSNNPGRHLWQQFPRNLSARQYHNPYRGIKKFCDYLPEPEWKKALKELTNYALCNDTIGETYPAYNILTMRSRLLQLIESCHLLRIRIAL